MSGTTRRQGSRTVYEEDETEHSIDLSLSWDLGVRARHAQYGRVENDIRAKVLQIRILEQEKAKKIRDLVRRLDEALKLIRLQEARVKLGIRRVELYLDRWEIGEIDILEYIRSQDSLENSRIELINHKTTYMELLGEYKFTVGR